MAKSIEIGLVPGNEAMGVTAPKKTGKFKDLISFASTALPVAGAIGTLSVWLAATFYVGEIQVTPDRPFNTLEVRVSDKKGQESVFHTPHFQLMPGQYHLEVTVDSQFKHHADIKAAFHKNTTIAVHVPGSLAVPGSTLAPSATPSAATIPTTATSTSATTVAGSPPASAESLAPQHSSQSKAGAGAGAATQPVDDDWGSEPGDAGKKHWWQFWKKTPSDN